MKKPQVIILVVLIASGMLCAKEASPLGFNGNNWNVMSTKQKLGVAMGMASGIALTNLKLTGTDRSGLFTLEWDDYIVLVLSLDDLYTKEEFIDSPVIAMFLYAWGEYSGISQL